MSLPNGFVPLRDVINSSDSSCFLGVITHIQGPLRPEPGEADYVLKFTIKDRFPGDDKDSVPCILKRRRIDQLPKADPGDIVILRHMKLEILGRTPTKTLINQGELQSQATFFPVKTIPSTEFGHDYHSGGALKLPCKSMPGSQVPTGAEQMAVIGMKAAAAPLLEELRDPKAMFLARVGQSQSKTPLSKKANKRALIRDIDSGKFHDLVGEVVKSYWERPETLTLYVTDYTTNDLLYPYDEKAGGDSFGYSKKPWRGPFGKMTMQIYLYEPHAGRARQIKEGEFVFLQNIRTKMSDAGILEGVIHRDTEYPDKVCVRVCTNQMQLVDLKARKAEYEEKQAANILAGDVPTNVPKKPSAIASAKKKQSKKEKRRLQREQERKELEEIAKKANPVAKGLNKNICSGDQDVAFSTVDEIVNNKWLKTRTEDGEELILPFVNSRYRTRLRVVDHYPLKLKHFTRYTGTPAESQATTSTSGSDSQKGSQPSKFEWHFFLLVEDAAAPAGTTPTRLPLTIDTPRAQFLLDMDPVDLSAHPKKLSKLEQKLFLLWGNLHERKIALKKEGIDLPLPVGDERLALSNKPFECCVEEYGVPVDDKGVPYTDDEVKALEAKIIGNPKTWKRTWSPYNTRIRD